MKFFTSTILLTILVLSPAIAQNQPVAEGRNPEFPEFTMSDLQSTMDIEVYPNPTTDFITITLDRSKLKSLEFEMYNIIGNHMSIAVEEQNYRQYKIDVTQCTPGYYLLVVKDPVTRFNQVVKFQKK